MTRPRLQIVPRDGTTRAPARAIEGATTKRRWVGDIIAAFAALALVLGIQARNARVERSAVERLPDRRHVYQLTLTAVESICNAATRPAELDGYCAQQVRFIVDFPECGSDCRVAVERTRRRPSPR